jgi:chemotaxis protein CheD
MPDNVAGTGIVVGVADLGIGTAAHGQLITYALGSCIGLTAYDPVARVGGLLHFMLPQPGEGADARESRPCMYGSTGIPLLFRRLLDQGAQLPRLILCAAGGAEIIQDAGVFAIGKRNTTILRKVFWKDGTKLAAEDTGGNVARTMTLNLSTGEVRIRTRDQDRALWTPTPRAPGFVPGKTA